MNKNKAFLFYPDDFLRDCQMLSVEERGKYITLLCHIHKRGRMKEDEVRLMLGEVSLELQALFKIDDEGYWYNHNLQVETNADKHLRSRKPSVKRAVPVLPAADDAEMQDVFKQWIGYRKLIHKPLRAIDGAYSRLKILSGNNAAKALQIVKYSIDNGYQGLFPINQNEYKPHKTITEQWLS